MISSTTSAASALTSGFTLLTGEAGLRFSRDEEEELVYKGCCNDLSYY